MSNYNYRNQNRRNHQPRNNDPRNQYSYSRREVGFAIWKFFRSILVVVAACLLVMSAVYFGVDYFLNNYWLPTSEYDTTPLTIEIPRNTPVSRIAEIMYENGLVSNAQVFEYYIDFSGYGKKMQAGTYTMDKTMTMQEIMEQLAEGTGPIQVTEFLIIEGSSITTTANKLLSDGVIIDVNAFLNAASNIEEYSSYDFISQVSELQTTRPYLLEGYLYPAKYEIYVGSSEQIIIKKMLTKFSDVFNDKRLARAEDLGLTIDQVVILASIIEKESRPNDFAKVSAVFYNRIAMDMQLGSCATVQYILGTNKLHLSNEDISIDSLYNTYIYKGLPAGPICSPSEKAIDAALYPDSDFMNEGYLYFATRDPESGELAFSKTLAEHNAIVAEYSALWDEYDQANGN